LTPRNFALGFGDFFEGLDVGDGLEVARERRTGLDGDDGSVVLPDAVVELGQQLVAFAGGGA
jgi:hypothetical protein